ncbi:septal ring lytic transglycosylase RlpA family protein [Azoarcus sp. KH32C]|uniref:septal ring lytic transglycosylase RlpA family protein n=1 Tax=Azoarcus sp. KH32C TaxID=748247 RepID=UPI0002386345|nr:septal ring lytic transglycosylase RlpA family protein [Azoarcus sp. KH32C]BAL22484.1 lipoprotein A [Azoarcus sp. KH32C]
MIGAAGRLSPLLALLALMLTFAGCSSTPSRVPPAEGTVATPPSGSATRDTARTAKRGGAFYKDDGPGDNPPPNLDEIPDAKPRLEPLHRFANRPYTVLGEDYVPATSLVPYRQRGVGSWYGRRFHGQPTSSGEPYDMYAMTAAHPTLPIPSYARVTNVSNGRSVIVRVNDRGPFLRGRVMDLSFAAAYRLGYANTGSTEIEVETIIPDGGETLLAEPVTTPVPGRDPILVAADGAVPLELTNRPAPPASAARGIFLQLGAFSSSENAEELRSRVRGAFSDFADRLDVLNEGARYRLRLGPFASADQARDAAERIARALKFRPFVVTR